MFIRHVLPEPDHGVLPRDPAVKPLSGMVKAVVELATEQARYGHQVEVLAPTYAPQPDSQRLQDGLTLRWLPIWRRFHHPRYDLRYLLPLLWQSPRRRPADLTHIHANPFLLQAFGGRHRVFHLHNAVLSHSRMYDLSLRRAGAVICNSDYTRAQFLAMVNYPVERTFTGYCGTYTATFSAIARADARRHYSISPGCVVILYAGRIAPEKGLHVLLQALHRLTAIQLEQITLLVAGSAGLGYTLDSSTDGLGEIRADLPAYDQQIATLAAGLPVRFLGSIDQPDMARFYRAGDIFVCPSIWQEPFGLINVEALAAGVPVVASRVGGIPEIISEDDTGYLVPPEDPAALAYVLGRLIDDPALRQRLAGRTQQRAARFDWAVALHQTENIYQKVMADA